MTRKIDRFLWLPLGVATVGGWAIQGMYLPAMLWALALLLIWHRHLSRDRVARDRADLRQDPSGLVVLGGLKRVVMWMCGGSLSRYAALLLVLMGILTGIILSRAFPADDSKVLTLEERSWPSETAAHADYAPAPAVSHATGRLISGCSSW